MKLKKKSQKNKVNVNVADLFLVNKKRHLRHYSNKCPASKNQIITLLLYSCRLAYK